MFGSLQLTDDLLIYSAEQLGLILGPIRVVDRLHNPQVLWKNDPLEWVEMTGLPHHYMSLNLTLDLQVSILCVHQITE